MKKLNVGSGTDIREGWVNLDISRKWGADIEFNLNKIYDGEKLPFKDNYFDKIIMYDVLEHLPEPLPILKELYRVCKIGGIINIRVPNGKWVWDNLDHKRQFSKDSFMTNNFDYYASVKEDVVEVISIKKYVLPSRNFIFKIFRWIFDKTNLDVKYKKIR